MDSSGIIAIVSIVISVCGSVLAIMNHKRIRSNCCGKELVTSIDVENTTPPKLEVPEEALKISVPS